MITSPGEVTSYLRRAKALIDKPEKWTTGAPARTISGAATSALDFDAVCFCSMGALYKLSRDSHSYDVGKAAQDRLSKVVGTISRFNDTHTHAEVMEAWDKAINMENWHHA